MQSYAVILGSGPAAFAVTQSLLRQGKTVTVVPGGGWRGEAFKDALTGVVSGQWAHEQLDHSRRAAIGGSGNLWGGRSILFDPIDFEKRSWVDNSGWPISHSEYLSFFEEAASLLDIHPTIDLAEPDVSATQQLWNSEITLNDGGVELWSKETTFSRKWRELVSSEAKLRFLSGAYCLNVAVAPSRRVTHVDCVSAGQRFQVMGGVYVIATGALENARLLLNAGFGKDFPALGRYYMSHLAFNFYEFGGRQLPPFLNLEKRHGTFMRRRWRLSEEAQTEHQTLNAVGFPGRTRRSPLSVPGDGSFSMRGSSDADGRLPREVDPKAPLGFLRASLHSHRGMVPVSKYLAQAAAGMRPPLLLPSRKNGRWALWFQSEHAPNPASKVMLSNLKDSFGNPRLEVKIDFLEADFQTAVKFHEFFSSMIESKGFWSFAPERWSSEWFRQSSSAPFIPAHQAGTTRMGASNIDSVVDSNSQVHGSENLYVAGSSIFPTSGHANPTLSIVMLSLRLARHLARLRIRHVER